MIDTHYDLLSICYTCYIKNDYSKIEKFAEEINKSGVKCIFANLFFESLEEMKEELDPNYYNKNVSILYMFKISKAILENYLPDIDFIYSIEGCDYLETEDLESLYNEGLRAILLVWNNDCKYGSGNRSNNGLTKKGREFLNKAIDLGIGIDLSHANIPTFFGMIDVIKENQVQGKEVICYASHSNARTLHEKPRNLNDEQLMAIKEVGGLVGLLSNVYFVSKTPKISQQEKNDKYLEHIKYVSNILGKDKVMLSTDDMRYMKDVDPAFNYSSIFDYSKLLEENEKLLLSYYDEEDTNNILYNNAYKNIVIRLLNKNRRNIK